MSSTTRRKYSREFRAEAVKLVQEHGLTIGQASRDLGIHASMLSRWLKKARELAEPGALSEAERREFQRLRKENAVLKRERDILKKAAAFFAKETL